ARARVRPVPMIPSKTLRSAEALAEAGLADAADLPGLQAVAERYAVAVTPVMAELIAAEGGTGPVSRQFLPDPAELRTLPSELADPIGDFAHSPVEGIVHRYPDRVLLKVTHTCAVYCRFCFRREMVGPDGHGALAGEALEKALAYIAARPEVWEVILTGGDPLVLSPRRLAELIGRLAAIGHVKVVRIHTRVPAVDPEAVTPELVAALRPPSGLAVWIALHANHASELTPVARAACARLIDAGLPMVSQSVLLKGVNDTPQALADLMRAFVETRIRPYYLHHPDLAPGTSHLRPTLEEGRAVVSALRGAVSGLCQPSYVVDLPGGRGKVPAEAAWLTADANGEPDYAVARLPVTGRLGDPAPE
ncbi:MAG: lysine-2,3-aminomutase-like protein, partial [Phenylobacterium sp.]